jgi:hypothetical protein
MRISILENDMSQLGHLYLAPNFIDKKEAQCNSK